MRKQYHTRQTSKKYARTLLVLVAQVVLFSPQTLVSCMLLTSFTPNHQISILDANNLASRTVVYYVISHN